MIIEVTKTDTPCKDIHLNIKVGTTIIAGFTVLKKMGDFASTDDEKWLGVAEKQVWEDFKSYK